MIDPVETITVINDRLSGFSKLSDKLTTSVPLEEAVSLTKGHYYELVATIRGANSKKYSTSIGVIDHATNELMSIYLTRDKTSTWGNIKLSVAMKHYEMTKEEYFEQLEEMEGMVNRAEKIFLKDKKKKSVKELAGAVAALGAMTQIKLPKSFENAVRKATDTKESNKPDPSEEDFPESPF